jgi:beta-lactam-binding protein with PASTA domain
MLAAPPKPLPLKAALPKKPLKVMPDLSGLTIRQALDVLHRSGLYCHFEGSGLAVGQEPPPGTTITPGGTCSVTFSSQP